MTIPVQDFLTNKPDYPIIGDEYKRHLLFDNLLDLLPSVKTPAISSTDGRTPLSHAHLKQVNLFFCAVRLIWTVVNFSI